MNPNQEHAMTTFTKRLTDWAATLTGPRDALASIATEWAAKTTRRTWLLTAPAPVSEQRAQLGQDIAAYGAAWRAAHGPDLAASLSSTLDLKPDGTVAVIRPIPLHDVIGPLTFPALCALAPDLIRQGLAAALPDVDEHEAGPPMRERPRLIAELDQEIAALEREHAALVDEAAGVGIVLQHLEITEARRRVAAHQAERLEEQRERDERANSRAQRLSGR